jgi:hypothetical protein
MCYLKFITSKWWRAKFCPDCQVKQKKIKSKESKIRQVKSGANAYSQIKQRCTNKNSKDYRFYGAKNIELQISKKDFINFYSGNKKCSICQIDLKNSNNRSKYGKCIDRIDGSKNYTLDNIRLVCRSCNTKISANKQFGKRPPKKELKKLYIKEKWSIRDICIKYNVTHCAVHRWFEMYEIKRRTQSEANYLIWQKKKKN